MTLNAPGGRQRHLARRLHDGDDLSIAEIAEEFGVSLDTARRDLIALEAAGVARRVHGGAVPRRSPDRPMPEKIRDDPGTLAPLARAAATHLEQADTILVDGGLTALSVARMIPARPGRMIATPSPWVAIASLEAGHPTHLLGGQLNASGGIATGADCSAQLAAFAADVAVLGACGIDTEFGLSSDDLAEAATKRAMAECAAQVMVVTSAAKLGARARFRTLALSEIDLLVTDATPEITARFESAGLEVHHA
ncbi:DeoR/GlpR family DNA-binding transcription regulator [Sulfitobacter sp. D35]|uniref:DeoR/GlpR family DNA-binding transcription regulator n=1 Tax=Sulfitobacter sp. D35 TaxID=3083252 RepID=UPI00296F8462|nr:DeoR/GlpR family DNA-binding transcription regulator [Sulfitobacter sp. D35]MDW4496725.1 DeoR/GlpR family DNA-binding transcription regulator [Sulfitobacter sp. D35]